MFSTSEDLSAPAPLELEKQVPTSVTVRKARRTLPFVGLRIVGYVQR